MFRLKIEVLTAVAAWALTSACHSVPVAREWLNGICPRGEMQEFGAKLSSTAKVYFPGSSEFDAATARWSTLAEPNVTVVVVPGSENDVVETVKFANEKALPFLAYNGAHGALTTLGRMQHGIEINLNQLSSVKINDDGTATFGGGTTSKTVTDELWAVGKQAGKSTPCVSYLGPALGGGHGWLQGQRGLAADQFVSMNVVLADGTLQTIDETSELWWAMKGAGHNFGIVTSVTSKIFDIEHHNWAIETITFSGDKVEAVYQAANDYLLKNGTQPVGVINWSYWMNNADADPNNPVIVFYIIQEGVTAVDSKYTKPFHKIGAISVVPDRGTYKDLAAWTGIANTSIPCQKAGFSNPRFPIYLESYNVTAQKKIWDVFSKAIRGNSVFNNSMFQFEGYSTEAVNQIDSHSSAFAFRGEHLLVAPLINYMPAGAARDRQAHALGTQLRNILHEASGRKDMRAYVNYAYGDESAEALYGSDKWRQSRLRTLKKKYDPAGKFSFYAPIP
ncbi:FAD-dependent oxygenase [Penicillium hispanicum]|uniref:FAD-dependent oxygenase n=1 Tax=Penicillium hispanicum TaxID=1080232 RepID=UPI0025422DCF|nr:FAD-dependent oxygenase [Penicillium hispanicum]KAJ5574055.1 FAD-dependent oxygenase [Penicillium hispanicum]